MTDMTNAPAPSLPLPVSEADLAAVVAAARVALGTWKLHDALPVPAGVLLRVADETGVPGRVATVLTAAGYTARVVTRAHVLVSGALDRAALLDAQIARLTQARAELGGAA